MKIKLMLAMLACAAAVMAAPVLVQVETTNPRPWNNLRLNMDASYTWGNNTTQSYDGIDNRLNRNAKSRRLLTKHQNARSAQTAKAYSTSSI